MEKEFIVNLVQIRQGHTQKIASHLAPSLLEVDEPELQFRAPIVVKGEVYLSDETLIVRFNASTEAQIPCAVCNQLSPFELKVFDFQQVEPISSHKEGFFDLAPILREALLLELPKSIECNQGLCPERKAITPYINTKKNPSTQFPFANL